MPQTSLLNKKSIAKIITKKLTYPSDPFGDWNFEGLWHLWEAETWHSPDDWPEEICREIWDIVAFLDYMND